MSARARNYSRFCGGRDRRLCLKYLAASRFAAGQAPHNRAYRIYCVSKMRDRAHHFLNTRVRYQMKVVRLPCRVHGIFGISGTRGSAAERTSALDLRIASRSLGSRVGSRRGGKIMKIKRCRLEAEKRGKKTSPSPPPVRERCESGVP